MKERNPEQIARIDGYGCFLEIVSSMFDREKVIINVEQHNKDTNKRIAMNTFYLTFEEFINLSKKVELGITKAELTKAKQDWVNQGSKGFAKEVEKFQGGTPKGRLTTPRWNGTDEARVLTISPATSSKADVVIQIVKGDGLQEKQGIIVPKFDYKNPKTFTRTMVPLSYDSLRAIMLKTTMRIQSYFTAQEIAGAYKSNYNPNSRNSA